MLKSFIWLSDPFALKVLSDLSVSYTGEGIGILRSAPARPCCRCRWRGEPGVHHQPEAPGEGREQGCRGPGGAFTKLSPTFYESATIKTSSWRGSVTPLSSCRCRPSRPVPEFSGFTLHALGHAAEYQSQPGRLIRWPVWFEDLLDPTGQIELEAYSNTPADIVR